MTVEKTYDRDTKQSFLAFINELEKQLFIIKNCKIKNVRILIINVFYLKK